MHRRWLLLGITFGFVCLTAAADDWPQWRGANRDAKVSGFEAPKTWPKELTKKWSVKVGDGVATPSLVGDKLFVFSREGGNEVIRCLKADSGDEVWKDQYTSEPAVGPAKGFPGPCASPTVADGKVVTLGVRGIVTVFNAADGKRLWQKDDYTGFWPAFFTSSSPIVVDGLCVVDLGGKEKGDFKGGKDKSAVVAYELASGNVKWTWTSDGTCYASSVLLVVDGTKMIVAETEKSIVGLGVADGKQLWRIDYPIPGRGYNSSTPIVDGQTIIFSGTSRGTRAVKVEKTGDTFTAKDSWSNKDASVIYNTPIVKDGRVFGITTNDMLFCLDAGEHKTAWTAPYKGGRGYGSIVDAGSVLIGLNPTGRLIVFEPSDKDYKELASYKLAERGTYAYPVVSGKRIYVKDTDSVTLWTIE